MDVVERILDAINSDFFVAILRGTGVVSGLFLVGLVVIDLRRARRRREGLREWQR